MTVPTTVSPLVADPSHPPAPSSPSGRRRLVPRPRRPDLVIAKVGSVLVLLVLWEAFARISHINPSVVPSPTMIIASWWDTVVNFGLIGNVATTLEVVLVGFGVSAVLGLACGIGMGLSRVFRRMLDPYVTFLLTVPFVAVVPALVVWLGVGTSLRMVAAGLFAFPLIVVNSYAGIRTVDRSLIEMGETFQITGPRLVTKILLPAALPSIAVGLQQGLSSAVKGVILAEMLASYTGLGSMVVNFGASFRSDHLLAVVFTILLIVLLAEGLLTTLRRRLAPWVV